MRFIVIYGPPCAGKTTIAIALSEILNMQLISSDIIRKRISGDDVKFTTSTNEHIFNVFIKETQEALQKGKSVICEGLFMSNERKKKICDILPNKSSLLYVTAPIEKLLIRLNGRKQYLDKEMMYPSNIQLPEEMLTNFFLRSKPPKMNKIIINTDNLTVQQSISNSLELISKYEFLRSEFRNVFMYDKV